VCQSVKHDSKCFLIETNTTLVFSISDTIFFFGFFESDYFYLSQLLSMFIAMNICFSPYRNIDFGIVVVVLYIRFLE
jgi:hypothetical protein